MGNYFLLTTDKERYQQSYENVHEAICRLYSRLLKTHKFARCNIYNMLHHEPLRLSCGDIDPVLYDGHFLSLGWLRGVVYLKSFVSGLSCRGVLDNICGYVPLLSASLFRFLPTLPKSYRLFGFFLCRSCD